MTTPLTNADAVAELVDKVGLTRLAEQCAVKRQAIYEWKKRGIPLSRVNEVSKITGVPVADILPATARHVSTVLGRDCSPILGELIKAFY